MNERILIIQTAFFGDAVLTLPLIGEIYRFFNSPVIDVVCNDQTESIFCNSPYVANCIILKRRGAKNTFKRLLEISYEIKNIGYSKIFSPHRSIRSSFLTLFSDVRESYGFDNSVFSFVFKNKVRYDYSLNEVNRNLSLLYDNFEIYNKINSLSEEDILTDSITETKIDELMFEHCNSNTFVVAIGSQWATKKYPVEHFIALIKMITSEGNTVFLIGSSEEKGELNEIALNSENVINLAGKLDINEIPAFLKRVSILITNDSAPAHLALISGTKTLMIFCSTVPEFGFAEHSKNIHTIGLNDLWCKPCGIHGYKKCPLNDFKCGNNLAPEIIFSKVKEILSN